MTKHIDTVLLFFIAMPLTINCVITLFGMSKINNFLTSGIYSFNDTNFIISRIIERVDQIPIAIV